MARNSISSWGLFNGSREYNIAGITDYKLMKKIIQQSKLKEFYALDIGAGNFEWDQGLAEYLEEQTKLPKDIKVTIISLRGENYLGENVQQSDCCTNYKFGAFKIAKFQLILTQKSPVFF